MFGSVTNTMHPWDRGQGTILSRDPKYSDLCPSTVVSINMVDL